MNNDVIVNDAEFIRKIETEYTAEPFAVLGPTSLPLLLSIRILCAVPDGTQADCGSRTVPFPLSCH